MRCLMPCIHLFNARNEAIKQIIMSGPSGDFHCMHLASERWADLAAFEIRFAQTESAPVLINNQSEEAF